MKKVKLTGLIIIIFFSLISCQNKSRSIISYQLARKTFTEKILATGTLESANNYTIISPRVYSRDLKVAELMPEGEIAQVGDTVCILEASDISQFFEQYFKEYEQAKTDLIKQEANNALQLIQLEAQLKENELKSEYSKLDSIQLKFAPDVKRRIMELELKKSNILQQKIIKKLEAQKRINEQSIRALKSQIMQKEQLVQRYRDQIDLLTITAPKSGMVVHATSPIIMFISGDGGGESGGKVKVGSSLIFEMPLIELPELDSMQVSVMLQEADYKRVEKGQKVIIKPESLNGLYTTGIIKSKSLASKRMDYQFQVKSYQIVIDIDSLDNKLLPGLSANCEIIVQNIADTLAVPSISIFEKDSSKIVYVQHENLFKAVKVETGLTNGSETIITNGLTGSETIALSEPPYNYIIKPKEADND